MRELARDYLGQRIERRDFIRMAVAAGFSLGAARSAVGSLEPLRRASASSLATLPQATTRIMTGVAGDLVAEQIIAFGTRFVFICNSSGMGPLCDAVVDRPQLQFIQAVSEHQVMAMADGFAKASRGPAFATFSRVGGPLASANMYNAMKDRSPIIVMTDHASSQGDGRDGHEDLEDWLEPFKQYTKWRWLVKEANRLPEFLAHAFKVSTTAPGGPTFMRVPRNVLYRSGVKTEIFSRESVAVPMNLVPHPDLIESAVDLLLESESPLLYVGPEVWTSGARANVVELAELLGIPVTQARSWSADFPTQHPLYLGSYFYPMRFPSEIDLFFNLGARMPDQRGGPPLIPRTAKIIHASIESRQVGINYPTDLSIVADVGEVARSLCDALRARLTATRLAAIKDGRWADTQRATEGLKQAYVTTARESWDQSPMTWPRLLLTLEEMLDPDAIIVDEVGTEDWLLRSFTFADEKKTKMGRTEGRSLGWGVGASVGVNLAQPDKQVVALQGDGGFLYGQSDALWTMSRYDVPVILIVCNNRSYDEPRNSIFLRNGRSRQENKDMICYLGSPDVEFTQLAGAYGIRGERVSSPAELEPAIRRAVDTTREGRPYLLDVNIARTGLAADSTWYPAYSVADSRTRRV